MTKTLDASTIKDFLAKIKKGEVPCSCNFYSRVDEFNSVLRLYTKYRIEQYKMRRGILRTPFYQEYTSRIVHRHNDMNEQILFYRNKLEALAPCGQCYALHNIDCNLGKSFRISFLSVDEFGNVAVRRYNPKP